MKKVIISVFAGLVVLAVWKVITTYWWKDEVKPLQATKPNIEQTNIHQEDATIEWCNKQEKPMTRKVFAEAVKRLETNKLLDGTEINLLIKKNDGTELFGVLGGHGRSAQNGYHYDILSENGTLQQKIFLSEINTVLIFEMIKLD